MRWDLRFPQITVLRGSFQALWCREGAPAASLGWGDRAESLGRPKEYQRGERERILEIYSNIQPNTHQHMQVKKLSKDKERRQKD